MLSKVREMVEAGEPEKGSTQVSFDSPKWLHISSNEKQKKIWKYKHQRQDLLFSPQMKMDEGRIKCVGSQYPSGTS